MPRISDNTLLQQALDAAELDRESLALAYGDKGPDAQAALDDQARLKALNGKKIAGLNQEEQSLAFLALVWAEQWEESLADAQPSGSKDRASASRQARAYRELRHRRWGKSQFETFMETAKSVPITDLLSRPISSK